jgi:hypothetical protein
MTQITKIEAFILSDISDYSQVYYGTDRVCRCGCKGEYTSTSYMNNPRSTVNDILVQKRLKRAIQIAKKIKIFLINDMEQSAYIIDFGDNNINVSYGNNKALTFYTNELKTKN